MQRQRQHTLDVAHGRRLAHVVADGRGEGVRHFDVLERGCRGQHLVHLDELGREVGHVLVLDRDVRAPAARAVERHRIEVVHEEDAGVGSAPADLLEDGGDLGCGRLDGLVDLIDASGRETRGAGAAQALGRAGDRGGDQVQATFGVAHEPDVVASDADGHEVDARTEGVELRRRRPAEGHALGLGHVGCRRAAAARVVELGHVEEPGDLVGVVGARLCAAERHELGGRRQRPAEHVGRVGVTEGDVVAVRRRLRLSARGNRRSHDGDDGRGDERRHGEQWGATCSRHGRRPPHLPAPHLPIVAAADGRCRGQGAGAAAPRVLRGPRGSGPTPGARGGPPPLRSDEHPNVPRGVHMRLSSRYARELNEFVQGLNEFVRC
jgi:hypothetical protein